MNRKLKIGLLFIFLFGSTAFFITLIVISLNGLKAKRAKEQETIEQHLKVDSINLRTQWLFINQLAHEQDSLIDVNHILRDSIAQLKPRTLIIPDNHGRQTIKF